MKLVIDRSKWLRGEGWEQSALLRRSDEKMCCLGFLGEACGVSRISMLGKGSPRRLDKEEKALYPTALIVDYNTENGLSPMGELMMINDDPNLSEETRESLIIDRMSTFDIEVEFI